jgi:TetR/AcrR family transcriptional regulator, transcriptional repressor for nem operon
MVILCGDFMAKKSDRRNRLIEAGKTLFSQQGFHLTTLADIATLADIPTGNVYYYFKTKDSIAAAVLAHNKKLQEQQLAEFNTLPSAKERLLAVVQHATDGVGEIIKFGNPFGTMCQELSKKDGDLAKNAAKIMEDLLSWCEEQFKSLDDKQNPRKRAINLVSCLQGSNLLTLTLKKDSVLTDAKEYIFETL